MLRQSRNPVVLLLGVCLSVESFGALNWTDMTDMPTGRTYVDGAVVSDSIYCIGGYNGSYLGTNQRYYPATDNWASRASMANGRFSLSVAPGKRAGVARIYAMGGYDGLVAALASVEEYTPSTDSWLGRANMTYAQEGAGAATDTSTNKVYVIGGDDCMAGVFNYNQEYDPDANSWATKLAMPTARTDVGVCAAVRKDTVRIYVIGGCTNPLGLTPTDKVEEYTPATNSWITRAPMLTARWGLDVVSCCGDKIFAIGGTPDGSSEIATVEQYDIVGNSWSGATSLNHARDGLLVETVGDKLYAIGGTFSGLYLKYTEESSSPCAVEESPLPAKDFRLNSYPNPFTQKTVISYRLPVISKNSRLTPHALRIYDLSGRLVKTLIPNPLSLTTAVEWDGRDNSGDLVRGGIYFLSLEVNGSASEFLKLVLVR